MVPKAHMLLALVMLAFMNITHAETLTASKTIKFENQREEIFDLENFLKETRYKTETVDSTCYRKEPYVQNVCRDVTRYREQCAIVPGHQNCYTAYEQVCRTENNYVNECHTVPGEQSCRVVVNYRQECSYQPGSQQCSTVPGRVECQVINGENRCTKIPPSQQCSQGPSQQVCRQVPYEERECSQGPSRQVCETVNRPQQVCNSVPRQQCDYVPAENVCSQVPYVVNECKDETLYNSIPYACKKDVQVPYEVTLKTQQANVQVLFDSKATDANANFTVNLDTKGVLTLKGQQLKGNKAVAFAKKDIKTSAQGDINTVKAVYNVALYNIEDLFSVTRMSDVALSKRTMTFFVDGKFDKKRASLAVKISKKDQVKFEKVLKSGSMTTSFDGKVTKVEVDLEGAGAPKLTGFGIINKTYYVELKLKLEVSDLGEVLLPELRELSVSTAASVEAN